MVTLLTLMSAIIVTFSFAQDMVQKKTETIIDLSDNSVVRNKFKTKNNDHSMPPVLEGDDSFVVYVGFYIESLGNIKETEMAYTLDIYMYQNWVDPRLAHNKSFVSISDQESLQSIWLPDLYFANAKSAFFQTVTVPNFVVYIYPDGTVSYSSRITMNLACNMDLKDYPLDIQVCMVKIMSYGHTTHRMEVRWFSNSPLAYDSAIDLPELFITGLTAEFCNGTFKYAITESGSLRGAFSCLLAKIHLERALGYHLVQTYIPTGMIVVISWVSFWIDPTAVPARVSLSFTTLLTLSTQGAGLRYSLPPVSYAKAIDFWYGTCMLFLFAALIEFAVVNTLMRKSKKFEDMVPKKEKKDGERNTSNAGVGDVMTYFLVQKTAFGNRHMKKAQKIDKVCRIMFPAVFITFSSFYWLYYKVLSKTGK